MRLKILLLCCAALVLTVGVASAAGGNSVNAKLCQKGGWQHWYTSNGSAFANQDACVAYTASGGTLTHNSQADCVFYGGTFSTDPTTDYYEGSLNLGAFVWSCNNAAVSLGGDSPQGWVRFQLFNADCASYPGGWGFVAKTDLPYDGTCYAGI